MPKMECTDNDRKPVVAEFQVLDVSVIAKSVQELTTAERYAVDSFMFLLRVHYRQQCKPLPALFNQTRKLVRDTIELLDQEEI